jgi:hypothetical protein
MEVILIELYIIFLFLSFIAHKFNGKNELILLNNELNVFSI